jgi:hypothetical protein
VIYTYLIVAGIVVFGVLGFRRGWLREVATLGGLLLAWLIVLVLGAAFVAFVNRLWLIGRFTVLGGFDTTNPEVLLEYLRRAPLIDPRHPDVVLGLVFVFLTGAAFFAANRFAPAATAPSARALGFLIGMATGYLVCYLGLRFLVPAARLGLALPINVGDAADSLGQYLPTLLLAGVVIAIVIALLSSKRLGARSAGRAVAGRAKG